MTLRPYTTKLHNKHTGRTWRHVCVAITDSGVIHTRSLVAWSWRPAFKFTCHPHGPKSWAKVDGLFGARS